MVRVLELFSGIGTQSLALSKVIGKNNVEIVGSCDFYLPALYCFNALHDKNKIKKSSPNISRLEKIKYLNSLSLSNNSKSPLSDNYWNRKGDKEVDWAYRNIEHSEQEYNNFFDITKLDFKKLPVCDLLTYSFPCQDISIQGKGAGFSKSKNTRSGLVWNVAKILEYYKKNNILPTTLLMENVSSICNKNHISNFKKFQQFLSSLGYENIFLKLNSVNFGSIQSRTRAFLVSTLKNSILGGGGNLSRLSLVKKSTKSSIGDILETYDLDHPWYKKTNFNHLIKKHEISPFKSTPLGLQKAKLVNYSNFNSESTIYHVKGKSPTLTATGANSRLKCFTANNELISICPKAAFQLMGHTKNNFEKMYEKIKNHITYSQLIHVAGNAISMEVLVSIFKLLYKEI